MSNTQEQNQSNNTSAQKEKYSDSVGRNVSKAKAMEQYKKAREGLLEKTEEKIGKVLDQFHSGEIPEAYRQNAVEIEKRLSILKRRLHLMNIEWKQYTGSYAESKDNQFVETMDYKNTEVHFGRFFLNSLKSSYEHFEILENFGMNAFSEISESFAVIKNVKGHYDELTNGSLQVPENAEYHIKAKNPNIDANRVFTDAFTKMENYSGEERNFTDVKDIPLFLHDPSPDDITQGVIGDCWLVSTLSAVCVNNPQLIRDMMRDNEDGTVTVRLYAEKNNSYVPYYVTVDKSVPESKILTTDGGDSKGIIGNRGAIWVQMIEKAYAASGLHKGSFNASNKTMTMSNINAGFTANAMNALFGGLNVDNKDIHKIKSDDEFFQSIKDAIEEKRVITTGTNSFRNSSELYERYKEKIEEYKKIKKKSPSEKEKKKIAKEVSYGLAVKDVSSISLLGISYSNHAYTVTKAIEKDGEKYVVVRNPNGKEFYNALGQSADDNTIGYSTIPLKQYRKIFDETIVSTPIAVVGYKNPAQEISKLTNAMMDTFTKSRSITSYITFRWSMSDEFNAMYDAMKTVNDIAGSKAPSKLALMRAFADLTTKAEAYLNYTKEEKNKNDSNDRNLRVTIAKACKSLAEAYKTSEGEELAGKVTDITRNILIDRITYVSGSENASMARKYGISEEASNILAKLKDEELLKAITETNEFAKGVTEEKNIEIQVAESPRDLGEDIIHM